MIRPNQLIALLAAGLLAACGGNTSGKAGDVGAGSESGAGSGAITGGTTASDGTASTGASTASSGSGSSSSDGASGSTGSTAASTTTTTGGPSSSSSTTTTSVGFGGPTGGSGGSCYPAGTFVGVGNTSACCSGLVDGAGYCTDQSGTGGDSGSTTTTGGGTTTSGGGSTTGASCPASCYAARGYHCENGQCVLNGGTGPIQVTLLWDTSLQSNGHRAREDLDLHLTDPNGCEIYFGHKICGGGSLDLDQNPACSNTDNNGGFGNDTENIIYDPNAAPLHGTYSVYVDDYEDGCNSGAPNPFKYQVTIRYNGQSHIYSGQFHQGDADSNSHSAPGWVHIADFAY